MREFRVCRSECVRSSWSHIDDDWYVCSFSFSVSGCKMHICVYDRPVLMISFRFDSSILFLFLLFKQKLSAYWMYRLSARCARLIRIHWRPNRHVRACERLTLRIKAKFEHPFQLFLLLLRHRHQLQFQLIFPGDNDIFQGGESSPSGCVFFWAKRSTGLLLRSAARIRKNRAQFLNLFRYIFIFFESYFNWIVIRFTKH